MAEIDVPYLAETDVPHNSEMEEVPRPSEAEAPTTIEVTLEIVIDSPTPHTTTGVPTTGDMEVTPPVETNVIDLLVETYVIALPFETYVIAHALTNPSIHTDEGFPGGPNDYSVLT
ncbi:unnamed protein product [Vicia faba]|uniref:Uncharacterized protein n=1 Tax=Vicia faba TaxID=3906 RepID=A0AAV0ZXP0_VICFA|nr:unnamed protein product [Vicia faba]